MFIFYLDVQINSQMKTDFYGNVAMALPTAYELGQATAQVGLPSKDPCVARGQILLGPSWAAQLGPSFQPTKGPSWVQSMNADWVSAHF